VAGLDPAVYRKLVKVGLAEPREAERKAEKATLAAFIDGYIASRSDVKESTAVVYGHTRRCLLDYFSADKPLADITPDDVDDWRRWLTRPRNEKKPAEGGMELSENTARRRCGIAKQLFRAAVRRRLIAENPFADMKGLGVQANRERDYFVSREEAAKFLMLARMHSGGCYSL
jgi:hypothetical protein